MADPTDTISSKRIRTALACTFCRQRKTRCSGGLPRCTNCTRRQRDCVYPGYVPFQSQSVATSNHHVALGPGSSPRSSVAASSHELPSNELRRAAMAYFREHYAPTLLCFIPPQQLVEDDVGERLPSSLVLCILALVSRCIPAFTVGETSPSAVSEYYADLARHALGKSYEEPSLVNVQCCLILCIYEMGDGSEHRGWLRLGHAARLAQLLQLHRLDWSPGQLDWGNATPAKSVSMTESMRRTFWCCFCLERLLANGRDRIATLMPEDITTRFPQSDENFIYERDMPTCRLSCSSSCTKHSGVTGGLFGHTIRIIDVLSKVMTWHGRGGRHLDPRCPWLPDMPFTVLDDLLCQWRASIPAHLDYTQRNIPAVVAAGQGKLWSFMFMIYFQARVYLYREYLPFTPKEGYDPATGPCDGPTLVPSDAPPPDRFWYDTTAKMVGSANAVTDLYEAMKTWSLSPAAYPFPGLGLLAAASVHVIYSIFGWESMQQVATEDSSKNYLRQDMEAFNHLGQQWSLAVHWIRQVSLYYKLNSVTRRSLLDSEYSLSNMDVKGIIDGIMNYVRQIGQQDRATRELSLKDRFDFEGWLSVVESSVYVTLHVEAESDVCAERERTEEDQMPLDPDDTASLDPVGFDPFPNDLDGLAILSSQVEWMFDNWDGHLVNT